MPSSSGDCGDNQCGQICLKLFRLNEHWKFMADRPVPLIKMVLIVASGTRVVTRYVQNLRANRHVISFHLGDLPMKVLSSCDRPIFVISIEINLHPFASTGCPKKSYVSYIARAAHRPLFSFKVLIIRFITTSMCYFPQSYMTLNICMISDHIVHNKKMIFFLDT